MPRQSGLDERRPIADADRIGRIIANADLVVTARQAGKLVGVSRALTDFCFCCYCRILRSIGRIRDTASASA
nr:hypothetical protein [Bradyrhizobium ivorense]